MEQLIAAAADTTPIDVNMDNFMAEVIDGSAKMPIVVQFWAPWCGPCKQLGPLLEKVVAAAKGKVKMVRINIDENQQIAQQMRVQSVPTVYGFFNGQPVDGFAGAQPESTLKQFIDKLVAAVAQMLRQWSRRQTAFLKHKIMTMRWRNIMKSWRPILNRPMVLQA